MPFYKLTEKGVDKPRLVEADNPAAALKHAATSRFELSAPLKTTELVALISGGVSVEKAGEYSAEPAKAADDK